MNYFYSKTTDLIYPSKLLDRYKDLPDDLVKITSEEASLHMGNIELPDGKQRKKHVYPFEFEDIPQPTAEEIAESNRIKAKATRDNAVSSNITVHDAEWQVANDAEDIRKVIGDAETIDASEEDSVMFRLADNSWRETTLAELRDVLKAHIARKQDVWNQMAVWDSGDKQEPFEAK